jgi:hypothetical protein
MTPSHGHDPQAPSFRAEKLTDAEARTLTRRELMDRIEAEQQYWFRKHKGTMSADDEAAWREFSHLLQKYCSEAISGGLRAAMDLMEGRGGADYWDTRPGDVPAGPGLTMGENQRAGLAHGLRLAAEMGETEGAQ